MVHFIVITVINSALRISDRRLHTHFSVVDQAPDMPGFVLPGYWGELLLGAYLIVVSGAAALTWRFVEEPARLWFNAAASNPRGRLARTIHAISIGSRQVPSSD
jgi:peptidoglycan/LPS O-acetylase OafA/YrhL